MKRTLHLVGLSLLLTLLVLASCAPVTYVEPEIGSNTPTAKSRGHGPPPHAPAHGYRAKTVDGAELVFDSRLGVYTVVDMPSTYYLDGHFYRHSSSRWQWSVAVHGNWHSIAERDIPPGLRGQHRSKSKTKKT